MTEPRTAVLLSVSSGIGIALADHLLDEGWRVVGTYRAASEATERLGGRGVELVPCDLTNAAATAAAGARLRERAAGWTAAVLLAGTTEPIGRFEDCSFDEWERSASVNLVGPLRLLHALLPARGERGATVVGIAGGGTNSAPVRYSAYTTAKVALVKAMELLDAESPDVAFASLGPGWVDTPIHGETLRAGIAAGDNLARTMARLEDGDFTPMASVVACCAWLLDAPHEVIGGRNFSVVHDPWGAPELAEALRHDTNLYKLRRYGNDRFDATGAPR